ncbi:MAG: methyltransferase domain-containing protein [Candidatus Cloacimonetes bacterium]|nr:methyltransferase domain-containing protein [Candidatus Cloacimonadota bacterium]
MKTMIRKLINSIGYDINRIPKDEIDLYYKLYGKENVKNRRFYNIGTGSFRHSAWTNVDDKSNEHKNSNGIEWDLMSLAPIPLEDNCAEIVYSSHKVEHITDPAAQNIFNESYRILKKGGIFRVTTPNIDLYFRAYKENDRYFFYWIDYCSIPKNYKRVKLNKPLNEASIQQIFLEEFATSASTLYEDGAPERITDDELDRVFQEMEYEDALNYCISKCSVTVQKRYPEHHINWWNKNKMFRMLGIAGFENINLSGYGQSFSPVLRNTWKFDNTNPKISLYVEAIK